MCGKEITALLSQVAGASGTLCLECSGATIEDFMEEGIGEDDYLENEIETRRTFHGKGPWD